MYLTRRNRTQSDVQNHQEFTSNKGELFFSSLEAANEHHTQPPSSTVRPIKGTSQFELIASSNYKRSPRFYFNQEFFVLCSEPRPVWS